ncbi:homogentisate 1,2-dioxygenase [Beauveria bassiana ARSEF 2860]|uniref:homogentisate 1,2-dioxygenase n=1 Tax=Beauveria bassiana (strain ARSEF 2860) TaxID=655819 RepID=J5J3X5_BEAB2|nr:homogentisate 1,2-dioxygenase [Beauveria bassiana ARSEF 2860]EJP61418.1 homogentisate 1,2-dioxygenase [Beauveria bassiana ARSEF 2860]
MASLAIRPDLNPLPPTATAKAEFTKSPTANDPYSYTTGFGNRFISQALPGVISWSQNTPQKVKYDLYSEQLNGSAVNAKRSDIRHVWMYRIRPSVAHGPIRLDPSINEHIESSFLSPNPKVESCASQQAWDPFPIPAVTSSRGDAKSINFVQGIRTIGGKGDAGLEEGLAVHTYSANADMERQAFCNNDGEMLILPQQGRLDITTELGPLMVRPGEVFLMPSGMRFRVKLPDGPSRGYIHEVFAAQHDLPERGVIGPNGMSMERNYCAPLARYDIDEKPWSIIYKMDGSLHRCEQKHTPFDVVAWHGNHVPVKYDLHEFISLVNSTKDQADPTLYTVLSVKSNKKDTPLSEFLIFTEKWITAEGTFRPPYYHRNMSTEIMGLVFGEYGGSSHVLAPGGLSYEAAYMPHGETYETWKSASNQELGPVKICKGTMAFMFHIGGPVKLTKWAMHGQGAESLHPSDPTQWNSVRPGFFDYAEQIAADIAAGNGKR